MTPSNLTELLTGRSARIHLIGVAGSGMSGIAALVLALGHRVSGSDRVETIEVDRLRKKGLQFQCPHRADEVDDADVVIYSSAIKAGNPAFDRSRQLGKPMVRRADALAAIMAAKKGVVVCGMHGKTTTSAMAAHVLRLCGYKPSHYVGAEIPILGTNARWDSEGELFVAEGDESDGTLINYHPEHAIVLNIEPEHLDFYKDLSAIDAVYAKLISQTRNRIVFCADDPGATRVAGHHPRAIGYGASESARYRIHNVETANFCSRFSVSRDGENLGTVELNVPGAHNATNALGVIALAMEVGANFSNIVEALKTFRGARRRFEIKYQSDRNIVVDDYGHHPTEIAATLATARTGGWKRSLVMFQPHRFTRTVALKDQFGSAFSDADSVVITDIYPASERPIPGVSGLTVVEALQANNHPAARFQPEVALVPWEIGPQLRDGDLIMSLGAGNIHQAASQLAEDLRRRDQLADIMGAGSIKLYEPLAKHTTMKIGGPAQYWVEPETEEGFAELVRFCADEEIPFMVIGRGSNLLVRDGGIRGVVACLAQGEFAGFSVNGDEIHAGAGVKFKQLAALAKKSGLGGFEWMDGIPGNVGGGLRMNAGAMGTQTFDQVVRVRFCDSDGNIFSRTPSEMTVQYRSVPTLIRNYALSAVFRGVASSDDEIAKRLNASESHRRETQPIAACAGCIFKNPDEIPAGRLIEELGFKNFTVGHARVSEVHGNFIVNDGGATATEVLTLIEEISAAALRERGITLQTEVQIVGEEVV